MLRRDLLRPAVATLFGTLCRAPELSGITLIGGTALALQIGHRVSLDLDFATFDKTLPAGRIDQLMSRLKNAGHAAQLVTSPSHTAQFKINTGKRLQDYVRDYVVDGVKVTFFAHGKSDLLRVFYRDTPKVCEPGMTFDLLGIEGLKVAKTLVLADRVRSRDLYDLMILVRDHGFTPELLFAVARNFGTVDDPEHYKAILRGEIPLDSGDEGLEPADVAADPAQIHRFFSEALSDYEITLARDFFLSHP